MPSWITKNAKLWTALIGAVVTILVYQFGADSPWVVALTTVGTALGVYGVPNE